MRRRYGFTLIELLAVIVVLGIIVLVIAPNFMDAIATARQSGYKETLMGVLRAVSQDSAEYDYDRHMYEIKNGKIVYNDEKIDYNGSIEGNGTIEIDLKGNTKIEASNGQFCGIKPFKSSEIIVKDAGECPKIADTSGASTPELLANMYPVVWDASQGSWVIASEANYENNEWYNYGEKRWANAITVTPSQREKYRTAKVGDVVDPVDVVGYYVWIPRFQYRAFATGPTEIEISFNLGTTSDESLITHPAFRFGGREISGFWVGKFETTGTSDQPTVLPNVTPISGESLNTYFESSRSFSTSTASRHGFNERKSDTHLMKNSEWGAVAYLSHSKYGTLKEITANGSGKTGGGNYRSNVAQSTTGNIYGVYDMSGGVGEYVMGNNLGEIGESHMSELPETKYYDYYSSYSATNYEVSLNGDAVKEVATWYGDTAQMVTSAQPWFIRGGAGSGATSGIFSFSSGTGTYNAQVGYRVTVIAI